jgi:hypothetical protein
VLQNGIVVEIVLWILGVVVLLIGYLLKAVYPTQAYVDKKIANAVEECRRMDREYGAALVAPILATMLERNDRQEREHAENLVRLGRIENLLLSASGRPPRER